MKHAAAAARYDFSFGLEEGWRRGLDNLKIALGFIRKGKCTLTLPHRIKRGTQLAGSLDKAAEIVKRDRIG